MDQRAQTKANCCYMQQRLLKTVLLHSNNYSYCYRKKSDATRAWIKEAGRMNHLKHIVP